MHVEYLRWGGICRSLKPLCMSDLTLAASSSGQFPGFHMSNSTASLDPHDAAVFQSGNLRRCSSGTSLAGSAAALTFPFNNIYLAVWRSLLTLATDPHSEIMKLAKDVVGYIKDKIHHPRPPPNTSIMHMSSPACLNGGPASRPANMQHGTPPPKNYMTQSQSGVPNQHSPVRNNTAPTTPTASGHYSLQFSIHRKMFDKGPSQTEDKDLDGTIVRLLPAETSLFAWCCRQFNKPVMQLPEARDPESDVYHQRLCKYLRNSRVRARARYDQRRAGFSRLDDQIFVNRNNGVPHLLSFHPYETYLAVADKDTVSIWDWESGTRKSTISNSHHSRHTRISSLEFLNPQDKTLLLCGTDDGAVRVWKQFEKDDSAKELVTAFQALTEMLPLTRGSGLVTRWEQESSTLISSGDVRIIRLWDLQTESKKQDIPTGADSCVTTLASDASGRSLLIAGCGDGTVRLFDRRLSPAECRVMTLREHNDWVIKVHLQRGAEGKIISASVGGDIRFWDPRFTESIRVQNAQPGFSAVDIHMRADVIACGSLSQSINVYNESGDALSSIKYHEGFLGQRIGTISCLAFHPYLVKLAAGSTDSFVSVYSTPATKR